MESELVRAALADHHAASSLHHCATVAAAKAMLAKLKGPIAVLADHQLTDGTVRDILQAIKGRPEVRVVVLSGCITPQIAALGSHANVVAVYEKPMGLPDLEAIVETALGPLPSLKRA